jgi:hypothetical protein
LPFETPLTVHVADDDVVIESVPVVDRVWLEVLAGVVDEDNANPSVVVAAVAAIVDAVFSSAFVDSVAVAVRAGIDDEDK